MKQSFLLGRYFFIQSPFFAMGVLFLGALHAAENNQEMILSAEKMAARRIEAHLIIKNPQGAIAEAETALNIFPNSSLVYEKYIIALSHAGDERRMMHAWETLLKSDPSHMDNRLLMEEMAWGVLHKMARSPSLITREMTLLAAVFSQDAKGVAILSEGLRDTNYAIRSTAVKLAAHLRDYKLKEEVKRLFREEKIWKVRKVVIVACGAMQIRDLQSELQEAIASQETSLEEKVLSIAALLEMATSIEDLNVLALTKSPRFGLKILASSAIAHFDWKEGVKYLLDLAVDPHADVRLAAFQALGLLRPLEDRGRLIELSREHLRDSSIKVAVSAAWVLALYAPNEGCAALKSFLTHPQSKIRGMAASATALLGCFGYDLLSEALKQSKDPFVRLNLARAAMGQTMMEDEAKMVIKEMLLSESSYLTTHKTGIFEFLSEEPIDDDSDELSPDLRDKLIRLELLSDLAMRGAEGVKEVVTRYLKERSVAISATAAVSLLAEGDESAVDLVSSLLEEKEPKVRLQAALLLSMWSRDESAIQTLQDEYARSSTELKMRVLEGLGRIGSMQSVPFLLNTLKEQSQTLRLIAAVALIQCLNH